MCGLGPVLQATGALMSAGGAYAKSQATKTAYQYQAQVARNNAQMDEYRAEDAINRGQQAEFRRGIQTGQTIGAQRARFAASGLSLDEGSPLNILSDTKFMGSLDRETIETNAAKEAYALRFQAENDNSNAALLQFRADQEHPTRAFATSLLGSANGVDSSWFKMGGGGDAGIDPSFQGVGAAPY